MVMQLLSALAVNSFCSIQKPSTDLYRPACWSGLVTTSQIDHIEDAVRPASLSQLSVYCTECSPMPSLFERSSSPTTPLPLGVQPLAPNCTECLQSANQEPDPNPTSGLTLQMHLLALQLEAGSSA